MSNNVHACAFRVWRVNALEHVYIYVCVLHITKLSRVSTRVCTCVPEGLSICTVLQEPIRLLWHCGWSKPPSVLPCNVFLDDQEKEKKERSSLLCVAYVLIMHATRIGVRVCGCICVYVRSFGTPSVDVCMTVCAVFPAPWSLRACERVCK